MSFNTFGKLFRFTTWGESHGPAIGCIVDGCPPLINLKQEDIQKELNKRKPGQSKFTTQRKESDKVEILSMTEHRYAFSHGFHSRYTTTGDNAPGILEVLG